MDFKRKIALVTGSSGGIGAAVAIALAKEGADVILAARNVKNMEKVKKEIEKVGGKAAVIKCDVSKDESVAAMKDRALQAFGGLDILINNAAVSVRGSLEDTSMDDWNYVMNTNIIGYVRVFHAFLPHFLKQKSGYIVNVSSIMAMLYGSLNLNTPYITSKAAIIGFTDCISAQLRPEGIKVSCLIPGGVITEIATNSRYLGTEERKKELRARDIEEYKLPFFLSPAQEAAGLLEGMKKEDYLILVPDMRARLKPQGKDVDMLNAYVASEPPPPPK